VYSRLYYLHRFLFVLALCLAGPLAAQGQAAAPAAPTAAPALQTPAPASAPNAAVAAPVTTATLRGHIADPTGALIPGAAVTIATAAGATVASTTADSAGAYRVAGLAPGSYVVQATFPGFAPFQSQPISLVAGQIMRVEVSMAIEVAQQSVEVTDESPSVNTEAGGNASAIVLKGADLDALSDDPDELSSELTALAGPAAGPNGGQIYIDGFTGGTLPPKSAIREIRINQNPFSAEFDHIGYGRIEILTKPGTDKLHGRGFLMGNDNVFNTGNPFVSPVPGYDSVQYNGTISGAMNKWSSFFLSVEGRNIQDESIYIATTAVLNPVTGLYSIPTDSSGNYIPTTGSVYNPSTRIEVSPRIDLQLGQKNTITLRYQYQRGSSSGSLGSTSLPTQATSGTSSENVIQLMDSQIINDHIVNETRFQYRRDLSTTTPVSTAPTVNVPGDFSGGGASGYDTNHTDHLELQNITTMSAGAQAIKFGTWVRDNRDADSSNANFNGSFSFPSLSAYVTTLNGLAQGQTFAQIAAACPASQIGGCLPNNLSYTTGRVGFVGNVFDAALFFQDDWKYNQFLTLSGGLRWETQNHTADHSDWGPRVAFAYALDGHKDKKQAKTVLRGGFGFFYDRFGVGSEMSLEQFNGSANSQKPTVIANPTCFNAVSLSNINLSTCGAGTTVAPEIYQIDPSYHAPTMEQIGTSLERQATKTTALTFTYLHSYGVHQMATRDSNAYLPGTYNFSNPSLSGSRPNPNLGIVREFYPEAVFKQNQVIVNVNARLSPTFSVMGFYNFTVADSNTGTASNSYNLRQDYGRAPFAARNMLFLMGNYTAPWRVSFNPFLIAQSGRPFNIVTNNDLTGDSFFNDRPSYATAASIASDVVRTSMGNFDTVPQPGETIIPANFANGPAAVALNLRVSRSFGLGPKTAPANNQAGGQPQGGPPPGGGGPGGGGGRGGPGGGFGGGGFGGGGFGGGGPRGGMNDTGHKYSLTFSAQALNLFNDIDYGTPSGTLIPTLDPTTGTYGPGSRFEKSTTLARGMFSSQTSSAARRIFFQAAFSF
jgi:hypothetical protein